jgi:hypothetical protein
LTVFNATAIVVSPARSKRAVSISVWLPPNPTVVSPPHRLPPRPSKSLRVRPANVPTADKLATSRPTRSTAPIANNQFLHQSSRGLEPCSVAQLLTLPSHIPADFHLAALSYSGKNFIGSSNQSTSLSVLFVEHTC